MTFRQIVLPLYGVSDEGKPFAVGTGFLMEFPPAKILVTAAHVLDERQHSVLYVPGRSALIELQGSYHSTPAPDGNRQADKIDVGLVNLPSGFDEELKAGSWFALPQMLLPSAPALAPYHYTFFGYPHTATETDLKARRLASAADMYTGVCHGEKIYQAIGADMATHIAIEFDSKRVRNQSGQVVVPKSREGTSGGPVFIATDGLDLPNFPNLRIAGIIIEHHSAHRSLLATKIDSLLTLVAALHPCLARPFPYSYATPLRKTKS